MAELTFNDLEFDFMEPSARLRQQKRSPLEIRALLVDAGEQILLAPEARGIVASLTLTTVFQKLESEQGIRLTNASVLGRVFESTEDFRRAVLIQVAASESEDFSATTEKVFRTVIMKADLSSPATRWTALQETCRVSANSMLETLQTSPAWRLWLGILAYAVADPAANADLIAALQLSYERLDQQSRDAYTAAFTILGFRTLEEDGLQQFSLLADVLAEGAGLRSLVDPHVRRSVLLPTGPDGKRQRWTTFALGIWALMRHMAEIDPEWTPL